MHMEKKEEKWSKPRAMVDRLDPEVSVDTLEKIRFAEVERERWRMERPKMGPILEREAPFP
ncbi:hypothetical protein T12_9825 [Trichinella patagoniensis]|uniref:Uncharacterized protein n=1 Tax=Trichinella patagoniensis TaxID=990121 RepID=A0A0V0ZFN8_9BILA|nr:hypothetical protein T12_9825 [Trichinella patagoniensis]